MIGGWYRPIRLPVIGPKNPDRSVPKLTPCGHMQHCRLYTLQRNREVQLGLNMCNIPVEITMLISFQSFLWLCIVTWTTIKYFLKFYSECSNICCQQLISSFHNRTENTLYIYFSYSHITVKQGSSFLRVWCILICRWRKRMTTALHTSSAEEGINNYQFSKMMWKCIHNSSACFFLLITYECIYCQMQILVTTAGLSPCTFQRC